MRTLFLALAIGFLLPSVSLGKKAAVKERPVLKADLVEVIRPVALPYPTRELVLNKVGDRESSFDLNETFGPPPCAGPICPLVESRMVSRKFTVIKAEKTDCGSTVFTAIHKGKKKKAAQMRVLDHSGRMCDDVISHVWEVTVKEAGGDKKHYVGNPKSVDTLKCLEDLGNKACIMLYAPATCSLVSIDGKELTPPLTAHGSNSCFAQHSLQTAACELGFDLKSIEQGVYECTMKGPVCPAVLCAAPPEGCTYESVSDLNEYGCPLYPCGKLVCGNTF
jgi:hypothetical protein